MKQNKMKLSKNERKFLKVLLERGNSTDTEIGKKTGLSKATCSRIRKRLEKAFITEYIPIIQLEKVGLNVFAVLMFQWNAFNNVQLTKKAFSNFKKDPHVVFLANGDGSTSNTVMFIAFEDLEDFHLYLKKFRKEYGKYANQISTLLFPSKEVIKHDFVEVIQKMIGGLEK